ncbi:hypothetical protein ACQJBY_004243 [Aegilops geniculata]
MSTGEEQGANKPPATVRIIETVYVEAGTADDFKSVVQRLTGRDSSAAALPEQDRTTPQGADRRAGAGRGGGASDAKRGS